ncbi:crossover junction endodeoxyribonuclease RuvC [Nostocoides sp.]|uniref:crossover junction endodeoxyribonuclease RuvC n=1 Tax=Nostocoides sp. TaxID=1917966 RepID=UPI003BB05F15
MRVLGVDPGLTRCGLGVVDGRPGRAIMVAVGVVRTPSDGAAGERLVYLERELTAWIQRFEPEVMAIERVFADVNVASVMTTAHATAIAMLVATKAEIPIVFHTPTEVKAAVTGDGRAGKAQVSAMVTRILKLSQPPKPADAADALALAICHAWRGSTQARYAAAAHSAAAPASGAHIAVAHTGARA